MAPDFVEALTAVIDAAGLAGRIRFTGVLTGPALAEAYADADLVVLPSRTESYGMAVAEALAHGVPVLAASSTDTHIGSTENETHSLIIHFGTLPIIARTSKSHLRRQA